VHKYRNSKIIQNLIIHIKAIGSKLKYFEEYVRLTILYIAILADNSSSTTNTKSMPEDERHIEVNPCNMILSCFKAAEDSGVFSEYMMLLVSVQTLR